MKQTTGYSIGIDLGSSDSLVAIYLDGEVKVIDNEFDQRTTPSYVTFTENNRLIGLEAKNAASDDCPNTVYDAKRLIGRWFHEKIVQQDIKERWPFKVVDDDGRPKVEVQYKKKNICLGPEEICAMIIVKLKETAESYLKGEVTRAVISVPAHFNISQRLAIIDAGHIAGLQVLGIINEPTAAAYSYGLKYHDQGEKLNKNVLIFDLGGGTFDVSVVHIKDGKFTVRSTTGNSHFGGDDLDYLLVNECVKKFEEDHGHNISSDKRAIQRLREGCQSARKTLSGTKQTRIKVDYLFNQKHFSMPITRTQFEQLCYKRLDSTLETVEQALASAKLDKSQVDDIVLVGGCSRTPRIRQLLQQYFDGKQLKESINPDLAVVQGAAIQAAILGQTTKTVPSFTFLERTPLSLNYQTPESDKFLLFEVFEANSSYPAKKIITLTTSYSNQTSAMLPIYQGLSPHRKYHDFQQIFQFDGIPHSPDHNRETPFLVTFKIDNNGCLNINAKNPNSGSSFVSRTLTYFTLTFKEIKNKILDAKRYLQEDQEYRKRILAKNDLESVAYDLKSKIETFDGQENEIDQFSKKLDETLSWLEDNGQLPNRDDYVNLRNQLIDQFNLISANHGIKYLVSSNSYSPSSSIYGSTSVLLEAPSLMNC